MEIWKLKSGRSSIYIEKIAHNTALFVNPKCEIIELSEELFKEKDTEDEEAITEQQKQKYEQYMADRRADEAKRIERARKEMSYKEIVEMLKNKQRKLPPQEWSELQEKINKALNKL